MNYKKIQVGKWYINKENDYGYYKVLEILKPKEKDNTENRIMVKCLHNAFSCNDNFGLIRYLRPSVIESIL